MSHRGYERTGAARPPVGAAATAFSARLLMERDDSLGAIRALERARPVHVGSDGDLLLRRAAIELALRRGQWAEALERSAQLDALRPRVVNPAWLPRHLLRARALAGLGRLDDAVAETDIDVGNARGWGGASAHNDAIRTAAPRTDRHVGRSTSVPLSACHCSSDGPVELGVSDRRAQRGRRQ